MAKRLTRIATRTGDDGTTGIAGGSRLPKDDARIEALGAVDELNCHLGVVLAHPLPEAVRACLLEIQQDLFDLGGELASPGGRLLVDAGRVARLEGYLAKFNAGLPPLAEFLLPGGNAAVAHVARAVCRRTERRVVALARTATVNPEAIRYLNRLSDLLFVAARVIAREGGMEERCWRGAGPG